MKIISQIYKQILQKEGLQKYQDAIRELIITIEGRYKLKLNKRYQHLRKRTVLSGLLDNSMTQRLERELMKLGATKIIAKITFKKTTRKVYFDVLLSPR